MIIPNVNVVGDLRAIWPAGMQLTGPERDLLTIAGVVR